MPSTMSVSLRDRDDGFLRHCSKRDPWYCIAKRSQGCKVRRTPCQGLGSGLWKVMPAHRPRQGDTWVRV
ncbi:hypothetical protein VFPPC_16179 [Pochonia chlamydosporia 170]|uniref:Uncharacterized protein n=1 Tax=Pochonia chlamydosporia 170 TaxID=1380566 RepID=A0A179FGQ4_METCM|nr:hypothetical protein VFPPC_16179 [Pochonia chlamydosporia 170]OAQ64229.1 hypothetical protein VFPPC_16179 [Pochonia chlamydosporia 170]